MCTSTRVWSFWGVEGLSIPDLIKAYFPILGFLLTQYYQENSYIVNSEKGGTLGELSHTFEDDAKYNRSDQQYKYIEDELEQYIWMHWSAEPSL